MVKLAVPAGMGGQLTTTEIGIIGGALELTNKTALQRMVPLEKVASHHQLTRYSSCMLGPCRLGHEHPLESQACA